MTNTALLLELRYFTCFEQVAPYFRGGGHTPVPANEIYKKFSWGAPGIFSTSMSGGGKWEHGNQPNFN